MGNIAKEYLFSDECREKLFNGIEIMYKSVSATLGPKGRAVLLQRVSNIVEPTKDGVTVAEEVYSADKWENMGMQLVRECSQKANVEAGDATTSSIVLAYTMCKEGLQAIKKNANVYQVSKGMQAAVDVAVKHLDKITKKIDKQKDYQRVASVSTQDDEIGEIIAKTFIESGEYGSIDIERSDEPGIRPEKTEGLSFDKGWEHSVNQIFKVYLTDHRQKRCISENVPILVVDKAIEAQDQLIPIMEELALNKDSEGEEIEDRNGWPPNVRRLLVICDDFKGDSLALLVANNRMNPQTQQIFFHLMFVKAPSYGVHKIETMKDICAVTGANFISEEQGGIRIEKSRIQDLGKAQKVIIEDKRTIIVANKENKKDIDKQITLLKAQIDDMAEDHVEKPDLYRRLATLTDGISVLNVGAESETERHELKRRVEDGVRAVRSARDEGVTEGCGVSLLSCIKEVDKIKAKNKDQQVGIDIVKKALESITSRILEVSYVGNSEKERSALIEEMKKTGQGYDFENECLGSMEELGVLDAKKAVRVALQSSTSVAMTFLKIEAAIGESDTFEHAFLHIKDLLDLK